MSVWERAVEFVLSEEGGYGNDPNDAGGETNFGISKRRYPSLNIKDLTREEAVALYKKDFWDFCHCDEIPPALAVVLFDAAVNQGEGGAIKMLQIALESVVVDGIMGDETITAVHKASSNIGRRLLVQRMARYTRTILRKPSQEVWLENWSSRLMRCAELHFSILKEA